LMLAAALFGLPLAAPATAADRESLAGSSPVLSIRTGDKLESQPNRLRIDVHRFSQEEAARQFELPGIPFLSSGNAGTRERGFSFSVRPIKGVRATARFRF